MGFLMYLPHSLCVYCGVGFTLFFVTKSLTQILLFGMLTIVINIIALNIVYRIAYARDTKVSLKTSILSNLYIHNGLQTLPLSLFPFARSLAPPRIIRIFGMCMFI